MEEILASIRRIIADDDASKPVAVEPPPPPAPPPRPAAAAPPARPLTPPPPPVVAPPRPAPPPQAASEPEPKEDVLDLTEAMTAATVPTPPPTMGPAPSFRTIDGQNDVFFADRAPEKPAAPLPQPATTPALSIMDEARRQFSGTQDRSLLSNAASSAVDNAFNSLAHTVLIQNARTLEDLVKEMLRPMLKAWLDDNLPNLVERIVRSEIERVSRGR